MIEANLVRQTAQGIRDWKARNPGGIVVTYVNTTAEVKALTDVCCTSSNAADVVRSIAEDKEILFLPDQFLGAHVRRVTGRKNIHVWAGECHVHADICRIRLVQSVLIQGPSCCLHSLGGLASLFAAIIYSRTLKQICTVYHLFFGHISLHYHSFAIRDMADFERQLLTDSRRRAK